MKQFRNIAIALVVVTTLVIVGVCTYYNVQMSPVSEDDSLKQVNIVISQHIKISC